MKGEGEKKDIRRGELKCRARKVRKGGIGGKKKKKGVSSFQGHEG